MLNHLQWLNLKSKRRNTGLTLLFKAVRNLVLPDRCLPSVSFTRTNNPLKFSQFQCRVNSHNYSFLPRTLKEWNNLKIDYIVIDTINLETFKNIIDNFNFSMLPLLGFADQKKKLNFLKVRNLLFKILDPPLQSQVTQRTVQPESDHPEGH